MKKGKEQVLRWKRRVLSEGKVSFEVKQVLRRKKVDFEGKRTGKKGSF